MGPVPGEVVGSLTVTAVVDVPGDPVALDIGNVPATRTSTPWVVGVMAG